MEINFTVMPKTSSIRPPDTMQSGMSQQQAFGWAPDTGPAKLLPFQRRFIKAVYSAQILTALLSLPRGNGKSSLSGRLLSHALTPGDPLFQAGAEYVLISGSIEQCRIVFNVVRKQIEPTGEYRFIDSATRCAALHTPTNTRLRVHGSNAKTAMGFLNVPLVVWDEPGAAEENKGQRMLEAIETAQGKPGSRLKFIAIGTLAPASRGFWHDLVASGRGESRHVTLYQGDYDTWDKWPTIRRANPLMSKFPESRAKLLEERDAARVDPVKKAQFLKYRLNYPARNELETVIEPELWKAAVNRPLAERDGAAIVGVDLGAGRAWSAAVAMWRSGRVEALAFAPGIPSIEDQERRDAVSGGLYTRLVDSGALLVAQGARVPPASIFMHEIMMRFGLIECIICDRFRIAELQDAADAAGFGGLIEARVTMWMQSSEDIRAFRALAIDGHRDCKLSIDPDSAPLITASLANAEIEHDTSANMRLRKVGVNNRARDDVAAGLVLAAGELQRQLNIPDVLDDVIAF